MAVVLSSIVLILVLLEYITRKQKNNLDEKYDSITRECLEETLDKIDNIKYTYGKIFAFNLHDLCLILIYKESYSKTDQLVVMHELGHFFYLSKTKDSLSFKALIYSKALFYFGGILNMFALMISLLWNPFLYVFKIILILLIVVQIIHLVLLTHSEIVANTYMDTYFKEGKESLIYAYTCMLSQLFYWLLFIVLTITLYGFIFN